MRPNTSSRQQITHALMRGALTGIALGTAFLAGFIIRGRGSVTAQEENSRLFPLLVEVNNLIETHYLREVPEAPQMEYAAIRGYLAELDDPYTFFIDPPVAQSESDVLAGQYGGIGVQVKRSEDGLLLLYPFRDSPAKTAGIEDGDVLVAVDGAEIAPDERLDVIDRLLRGEVEDGRGVTLTIQKPDTANTQVIFVEFAVVNVPSVVWRPLAQEPSFGYIQIIRFTSRTPDELHEALADLEAQNITALVLDLRSNSGGLLQESVEVASEFLDGGVVFYENYRDDEKSVEASEGEAMPGVPIIVLVNGGTASAAELVAGALLDSGRATLIGQTTYGKGSVQLIFRLADDSSVHITSAEWFTPNRTPLDGNGLEPTISMIPAEDGRDVELGEAIRFLRTTLAGQAE